MQLAGDQVRLRERVDQLALARHAVGVVRGEEGRDVVVGRAGADLHPPDYRAWRRSREYSHHGRAGLPSAKSTAAR